MAASASDRTMRLGWLALAVAFSPVLADLVRNLTLDPIQWSTLLAPLLLVAQARDPRERGKPAPCAGLALLVTGLGLELVGVAANSWSIARAGFPLGVIGMAARLGRPSPVTAALAFWMVPIPSSIETLTSPGLESALAAGACSALRALGVDVRSVGPVMRAAGAQLPLSSADGGAQLAHLLALLGAYAARRRGGSVLATGTGAAGAALLTPLLQPAALVLAGVLLAAGAKNAAELWLRHVLAFLVAGVGLFVIERRRLARGSAPEAGSVR